MPINNQNPQTPPAQIPDHRIDEIQQELGRLRDENQRLRGHIDYISQGTRQPQQQQMKQSPFEENVDRALTEKINQMIQEKVDPVASAFRNQLGYLLDQQDDVRFQYQYGGNEKYQKMIPKVERIRKDYEARGQYITREDALRMVYFEETGKKATEAPQAPAPQQQQPVFDPYFGTFVDPVTKRPVVASQEPTEEHGQQPPPSQQMQPNTQQTPWQGHYPSQHPQQPQQPWQSQQQMPTGFDQKPSQHPYQNPYGQQPQLPNQGINQPYGGPAPQQKGHMTLDINADDAALKAFEDSYGDIPL